MTCPATMADFAIGRVRKRSTTPCCMSEATPRAVVIAANPAGVTAHDLAGGVGEIEALQQFGRATSGGLPGQPVEPGEHGQVHPPAELLVDRRCLIHHPDERLDAGRLSQRVEAADPYRSAVWAQQGRQDAHGGRLAGPVRPERHAAL